MLSETVYPDQSGKSRLAGKILLHTFLFLLLTTQICFAQWYQQNSPTTQNLNAVTFIDENNGWAVGDSGTIIYTSDSGESWAQQSSGTNLKLIDVCFTNINDGWAIGGNDDLSTGDSLAVVLHTTNKGTLWIIQTISNIHKCFFDCNFINDNTGVIVGITSDSTGVHGVILQTTDKGLNWSQQIRLMNGPGCFRMSVHFNDDNIGWQTETWGSMFYSTYIHKTTDGGSNWYQQYITNSTAELNRIHFFNFDFGIGVGSTIVSPKIDNTENVIRHGGIITRTLNGGTSWDEQTLGIPELKDVSMVNTYFIVAVGVGDDTTMNSYGAILVSNDTGISWNAQTSGVNYSLSSISFIDSLTGWIVGDNGTILHTTNGGVSFVEEEQIDEIPNAFLLSQNYPNPFNPSTKIKYSIPFVETHRDASLLVTLKVFDILGNEIETLVNEEKPAGTYEISWHAENLTSGVYFYQLKAGEYVSTKKMLLLK